MTAVSDFHREYALTMSERFLQDLVIGLAKTLGYRVYHTHDSRRSEKGFPDLCIVVPVEALKYPRMLFAELKSEKGRLSDAQGDWVAAIKDTGVECHVWRPSSWLSGEIEAVLRGQESVEVSLRREDGQDAVVG